jgi:hypothetical protein
MEIEHSATLSRDGMKNALFFTEVVRFVASSAIHHRDKPMINRAFHLRILYSRRMERLYFFAQLLQSCTPTYIDHAIFLNRRSAGSLFGSSPVFEYAL